MRLRLRHCAEPQHEHGTRHNLSLLAYTGVGFGCWFSVDFATVRLALISFPGRGHESHVTTPVSKPGTREDVFLLSAECVLALYTSISPGISCNRHAFAFQCLPVSSIETLVTSPRVH